LVGLGMPEYEAKRYAGRVGKGGLLISVHCDDSEWTRKAREILSASGAEEISSTGEATVKRTSNPSNSSESNES